MIPLSDIFNGKPLIEDFKALSDPDLDCAKDREAVNRLILNFLIKYLAAYLEIPDQKSARALAEVRIANPGVRGRVAT